MDPSEALRLGHGLLRPASGVEIVGGRVLREVVGREHRELRRGATRQVEDAVLRGDVGQGAAVGLAAGEELVDRGAAVRVLEDSDARPRHL